MDNELILFVDCEFTDFISMSMISIALVGEHCEFYAEITDYNERAASAFVLENVLPLMKHSHMVLDSHTRYVKGTYVECQKAFFQWIDEMEDITLIRVKADYRGDIELLAEFMHEYATGYDDKLFLGELCWNEIGSIKEALSEEENSDLFKLNGINFTHHALVDARANKIMYQWALNKLKFEK